MDFRAIIRGAVRFVREWPWQVGGAIAVVLITRPLLAAFDWRAPNFAVEFLLDLAMVFSGFLIGSILVIYRLGPLLSTLRAIDAIARHPARLEIRAFIHDDLRRLQQTLQLLRSEEGAEMDKGAVDAWTQRCFELGEAAYDGVSSHVPSSFHEAFPDHLPYHAKNLEKNPRGKRILIINIPSLQADSRRNRRVYNDFLDWHTSNHVELLHIAPVRAKELAEAHGVPATDIDVWRDKYALLNEPIEGAPHTRLRMAFNGEDLFENCRLYSEALGAEAMPFTGIPPVLGRDLANSWEAHVDPPRRLALEGPVLLNLMEPYRGGLVMDAAAGIGCEAAFLLDNSFDVTANEIDSTLAHLAKLTARRHGFNLDMVSYLWQDLAEAYNERPRFDVILVLGGSFSLVPEAREREQCLRSFYTTLRPGGLLVIDERNFQPILDNKAAIERNPVAFKEDWGGVMYRGKAVRACPTLIEPPRLVTFTYYRETGQVKDRADVERNRVGTLDMYPFKLGDLAGLLGKAGFERVQQWSDFRRGMHHGADFFTYAAVKPPAARPD